MIGPAPERVWTWIARIVPCCGAIAILAFGWESLPPWHRPEHRVWRIEAGGASLERFAKRAASEPIVAGDLDAESYSRDQEPLPLAAAEASTPSTDSPERESENANGSEPRYWLNARSGVRHNENCRYFDPSGAGRFCGPDDGRPCLVCGG